MTDGGTSAVCLHVISKNFLSITITASMFDKRNKKWYNNVEYRRRKKMNEPLHFDVSKVRSKNPITRMHQAMGELIIHRCSECCNFHPIEKRSSKHICIAYDNHTLWDGDSKACEMLFNIPFRAIRPMLSPLGDLLDRGKRNKGRDEDVPEESAQQISFF